VKFKQHYSGSSGNLFTVTASNGKRLLIETGVKWPKLLKALAYDRNNFEGCLCTHRHKDHSTAISAVMTACIDVYALEDVFQSQDLLGNRRAKTIRDKDLIDFDSFQVLVFSLNHDTPIVGFVIYEKATKERLLFATDTNFIEQKFNYPFDIIAIECSFDKDILQKRVDTLDIHESLAKRLLTSHMEKSNTMTYIQDYCDLSKCREIHLLHCSGDNLDKRAVLKEFYEHFFIPTFMVGMK
jgi:phosphoribosyl 1,2-cyclic phosphodiesterase